MLPATASVAALTSGGNCVTYARALSGVELEGNAGAWWGHAAGRYQRGNVPQVGAVLVFKPSRYMRAGHVAVVSRVVGRREILVDQANWIPGRIVKNMSVIDASPDNDWTVVRVLELRSHTHGRDNPTFGFIYPRRVPARLVLHEAVAGGGRTSSSEPRATPRLAVAAARRGIALGLQEATERRAAEAAIVVALQRADYRPVHKAAASGHPDQGAKPTLHRAPHRRTAADHTAHRPSAHRPSAHRLISAKRGERQPTRSPKRAAKQIARHRTEKTHWTEKTRRGTARRRAIRAAEVRQVLKGKPRAD